MAKSLILASASPRRTALLKQLGIAHTVHAVDIDESPRQGEPPKSLVNRLAEEKAQAAFRQINDPGSVVLAADTLIALDNQSVGKPVDMDDCLATLTALSGRSHCVLTAISALDRQQQHTQLIETVVHFASLSKEQMISYWQTGEPRDKAGSYAIQGVGGQFVKSIDGSASAVVGLPLYETVQLLKSFGVNT